METHKLVNKQTQTRGISYELSVCIWAGVLISLSLIGFFLFMKVLGFQERLAFRYFNSAIVFAGIFIALGVFSKKTPTGRIDYLAGLKMGLRISLIAIIPFVVFMAIYLTIDESFMSYIREHGEFGKFLSPVSAAGVVAIEGFVGGAITTYMAMQFFKDNAT